LAYLPASGLRLAADYGSLTCAIFYCPVKAFLIYDSKGVVPGHPGTTTGDDNFVTATFADAP
jgi:hypothetical protein